MRCWNCGEENGTWALAEAWALVQDYLVSIGESASPPGPQDTPLGLLIEALRPSDD